VEGRAGEGRKRIPHRIFRHHKVSTTLRHHGTTQHNEHQYVKNFVQQTYRDYAIAKTKITRNAPQMLPLHLGFQRILLRPISATGLQ
jgi:hypothetical protein